MTDESTPDQDTPDQDTPDQNTPDQNTPDQNTPDENGSDDRTLATSLYDLDQEALASLLTGQPPFRVRQVWEGLYAQGRWPSEQTNLPRAIRERLETEAPLALTEARTSTSERGETVKVLWELRDGALVESVLMHYQDRTTVCVSTQAGCAMGCGFCATGQAGFKRHLSTGEIVEQVIRAGRDAAGRSRRVSNVVFMGMGEPLANYDRTWAAIRRLHDDVGISARHLTVSTVGIIPGIRRMATEPEPVNLAVSLHAANDRLRDQLVPINRRYPIRELVDACADYLAAKGRRVSFEWALIDGVNDRPLDARQLADLARTIDAHVNIIPLNPTPGYTTRGSSAEQVAAFAAQLRAQGVNATVRRNRGTDIAAACGQLAATGTPVTLGSRPVSGPARSSRDRS